jgi:hypothetical protein
VTPDVDKIDTKRTTESRQKDDHCVDLNEKDSKLLPCLIVYSLIQKRERVAHCLSVFYIEIFDFDNFDMILKFPCKKYEYFWKDCVY